MGGKKLNYIKDILKNDLLKYGKLEHERWNTFMLTEGWYPFDIEKAIAVGCHKLEEQMHHACITNWENLKSISDLAKIDFIYYDENFVSKTEEILNGFNNKFEYNFKIVKLNKEED